MVAELNDVSGGLGALDVNARIEPTMYARLFLDVLVEEGLDARDALKGTNLTPGYLSEPNNMITLSEQIAIYANIAKLKGHSRLSLIHGSRIRAHHHGAWGYAIQSAATVGKALDNFNRFFNVIGPVANLALVEEAKTIRWVMVNFLTSGPARHVAVEEMLSGNIALMKQATTGKFSVREIWLDYDPGDALPDYEAEFGCTVHPSMEGTEIRFEPELLSQRLTYSDEATEKECIEWCRKRISQIDATTGVSGAAQRLIREGIEENVSLELVAQRMNMSSRTLRRNLKREGTSFFEIKESIRKRIAMRYLRQSSISIDEIGHLLGYAEPSNFRQAFKKWTGIPPARYRKSNTNKLMLPHL